jgi:hypothetical protein
MIAAVLASRRRTRLARRRRGVSPLIVTRTRDCGRAAGKLDLQVETGAGQDLGTVERIDGLRCAVPPSKADARREIEREQMFHGHPFLRVCSSA